MATKSKFYYYKVLKNMALQDKIRNSKIEKHECLFENIENKNFSYEERFFKSDWIEAIENYNLYSALKGLSKTEKDIVYLLFVQRLTQVEVAGVYGTTHQNIAKKIGNIIKKIKASM